MIKVIGRVAGAFCALSAFASAASAGEDVRYVCDDKTELTATFHTSPGSAVLAFTDSEKAVTLPQVVSADGGRYAAGETEFWIKGRDATLTRGQNKTTCKS
jgi:membrane-bound inhibitor of C-type lysozyme